MISSAASDATWRLGSAAVVISFAFDPLGAQANTVALLAVIVAALQVFGRIPTDYSANSMLLVLSGAIVGIAALEILNPNVPSLSVGLVGFRKTATFVLGIIVGLGWRGSRLQGLRLTWWCMLTAGAVSLVVHIGFPAVAQAVPRAAGQYTSMIGGTMRMQGLLAGPFHVSMLGVFLVLSALAPACIIRQRWLRAVAAMAGLACVYLAQVRTGLLALAIGAMVMLFVARSLDQFIYRLTAVVVLAVSGVAFAGPIIEFARRFELVGRILDYGLDDSRFVGRFDNWLRGWELVERSPLTGWGSGSAGDTLGQSFLGFEHVTSHNAVLKLAIEGGLLQGILFLSLCVGLVWAVRPAQDPSHWGLAAATTFIVFGAVGAAQEALPVSLGLAVIWGLCAGKPFAKHLGEKRENGTSAKAFR